jgi:hypothetical protein
MVTCAVLVAKQSEARVLVTSGSDKKCPRHRVPRLVVEAAVSAEVSTDVPAVGEDLAAGTLTNSAKVPLSGRLRMCNPRSLAARIISPIERELLTTRSIASDVLPENPIRDDGLCGRVLESR